jgi:hypothetical protein
MGRFGPVKNLGITQTGKHQFGATKLQFFDVRRKNASAPAASPDKT